MSVQIEYNLLGRKGTNISDRIFYLIFLGVFVVMGSGFPRSFISDRGPHVIEFPQVFIYTTHVRQMIQRLLNGHPRYGIQQSDNNDNYFLFCLNCYRLLRLFGSFLRTTALCGSFSTDDFSWLLLVGQPLTLTLNIKQLIPQLSRHRYELRIVLRVLSLFFADARN